MITCQDARQLFDRYLDGELSPSLQAELHAHQLNCASCQNELAMLEACGDVIALDRREPEASDSFTDRVLLARRSQQIYRPRRWSRIALFVGSPMAAAASIALVTMLIMPSVQENKKTVTASRQEAVPGPSQKLLLGLSGKEDMSQQARQELEDTPIPAVGWMETLLARAVDKAQDTLEGTRQSLEELNLLLHMGFSDTNEKLAALLRSVRQEDFSGEAPAELPGLDPRDPAYLNPDPPIDSKIDDVPEAL